MKRKIGFTLIEVTIYLALSGLLIVGVIAALTPSINQQRFYDATQNFADFLRSVYSQVANPQSVDYDTASDLGGGRSNLAIYGKLIVFGEKTGLNGEAVNDEISGATDPEQKIYVYDVVGNVSGALGNNDVKEALKGVNANVLVNNGGTYEHAGLVQEYTMRWGTAAEKTTKGSDELRSRFKGSILIVRHPSSGTISTLFSPAVVQANTTRNDGTLKTVLEAADANKFETETIDFCVNRDSSSNSTGNRWNVRILENAHNPTDVVVRDLDGEDPCNNP